MTLLVVVGNRHCADTVFLLGMDVDMKYVEEIFRLLKFERTWRHCFYIKGSAAF